jgi:hypothetical protein
MQLLSYDNIKVNKKAAELSYYTAVLHFAPANISGYEVCPMRSVGCTRACLHTAGNPAFMPVKNSGRIKRTKMWFENREEFKKQFIREMEKHVRKAASLGLKPAIRLNGTSDIVWEKQWPELFTMFPNVQFYDYTKIVNRLSPTWQRPANYSLTLSRSEVNEGDCLATLASNPLANVAVVFPIPRLKPLPETWQGHKVIDGDLHDLRFLDEKGTIVGLRAKGMARGIKGNEFASGFVVSLTPITINNRKVA